MIRLRTAGFTLVELLIVLAVLGILLAVGLAGWRSARLRGNETAALSALITINEAQAAFAHACGNGFFAPTLTALGTPMPTTGQAFLSPDLTTGETVVKSGYQLVLTGTEALDARESCTGIAPVSGYRVTADPIIPGSTGNRFFGSNAGRVVYEDAATFADNMPESGAPGHGTEVK